MNKRLGRLGTAVVIILLAIALAGLLAPAFGYRLDVVRSGSMEPGIGIGDLLITAPVKFADIRAGDVISFRSPDQEMLVCHRVVAVDERNGTLQTKGDANEDPDRFVVREQHVVGEKMISIPLLGYAVEFLRSPFGWALLALLLVLAFVMGGGKPAGEKKEREGTAADEVDA